VVKDAWIVSRLEENDDNANWDELIAGKAAEDAMAACRREGDRTRVVVRALFA
jgi:hypothetical protein